MPATPSNPATGPPSVPLATTVPSLHTLNRAILALQLPLVLGFVLLVAWWKCRRYWTSRMESPKPKPERTSVDESSCELSPKPDPPPDPLVYPWISPPKPLPGPYDPRLFPPLPSPSIRRLSDPDLGPENVELVTATYTRVVSAEGTNGTTMYGHIVRAGGDSGWRRNQWTVQGG